MKNILSGLNGPKKLALAALVLGVLALFAGNPYETATAEVNTKELALIVENGADHVKVDELADWIIKGRSDYRLIDLNQESLFNEYHIPTAENIQITALTNAGLLRNEKIILYSDGGIHSAQAWMLLKTKDYKSVYMLFGGLEEWKDKILFPTLSSTASKQDSLSFNKIAEVSKFFGGSPQTGIADTEVSSAKQLPKLQSPVGNTPAGVTKKKKKEGC
jgi:3-mercaptopyruvate sulfurtransferase SseA